MFIGTFIFQNLIIYGEIGRIFYLIVYSNTVTFFNESSTNQNEMIDLNNNYYYSIPVIIEPCAGGYVYETLNQL